jgi:flagellar FliJ protein
VKRSRRLQTLVRLAGAAERQARLRLAQTSQDLGRKEQQGRLLESYDVEYAAGWIERGRVGLSGADLGRLAAFRASLASTIEIQQEAVRTARTQLARDAGNWSQERNRMRVFGDLVERARDQERRVAERREQRAIDDLRAGGVDTGE